MFARVNQKGMARVLVIYTGGTIGMKKDPVKGFVVEPNYFPKALKKLPMLYDKEFVSDLDAQRKSGMQPPFDSPYPELVMPLSREGVRVYYYIREKTPIIDSSNMSMEYWVSIATDIEKHYHEYDSFVILHGTDTMAYTASALSFMLENLGKTVIITGAQIPIFEQRNDSHGNLIGALTIAGNFVIPEVSVYFANKLLRGNRATKISTTAFDAFDSPNIPPLVKVGIDIEVAWEAVYRSKKIEKFSVHKDMNPNVGLLRLFPGIKAETVRSYILPPTQGVVVETFGAGNVPSDRPDLMEEFRQASERGVLMINITQCLRGSVKDAYAAGRVFFDMGVLPGYDMTPEAALTKLAYVLGKREWSIAYKKKFLCSNVRGELTTDTEGQEFSMNEGEFVKNVALSMRISSEREMIHLKRALMPVLLCCAAKAGDVEALNEVLQQGANINEPSDYDGKTCLHIACAEGQYEAVRFLLGKGASVYSKDRRGRMPLFDALRNKHPSVIRLMLKRGAHFLPNDREVARELCIAASSNDLERLQLWHSANVDMDVSDLDGRSPLHVAVLRKNLAIVEFLVNIVGVDAATTDVFGHTPLKYAKDINFDEAVKVLAQVIIPNAEG